MDERKKVRDKVVHKEMHQSSLDKINYLDFTVMLVGSMDWVLNRGITLSGSFTKSL